MSTTSSSAHRPKDRISKLSEKITPVSGKENPISRVRAATQKPNIRPIARIDKSVVSADEPRVRRSTSSVPRGRSSSPSEFTRALSDLRKNSRVSSGVQPLQRKVVRSSSTEKSRGGSECTSFGKNQKIVIVKSDVSERKEVGFSLVKSSGLESSEDCSSNGKIKTRVGSFSERKEGSLGLVSVKSSDLETGEKCLSNGRMKTRVVSVSSEKKEGSLSSSSLKRFDRNDKFNVEIGTKGLEEVKTRHSGVGVEIGSGLRESKSVSKVSSTLSSGNKYPSKLHEKLAFLEGKVKRIACDIKRTKEMLDNNNPDASKMILSDIQEKISGIEKAMVHVVGNDGGESKMVSGESGGGGEKEVEKKVEDSRSLVNGLNVEELEARLFPHHKLIRDRTMSKTTSVNVEEKESSLDNNAIVLESSEVQEVDDNVETSVGESSLNVLNGKGGIDALLMADESLNDFDDQENVPDMVLDEEEIDEISTYELNDIGSKSSTGGWFVSEGESVLLAHGDGSCSFYDIANCEEKAEYKPPSGLSPNIWQDCWIIRAPSADGCSGKYVVAASAGNSTDSGFCSWDFYTKDIRAFHVETDTSHVRTALAPLPNNTMYRRNALSTVMANENQQWWYKPCGPLIISAASCQKMVQIYDIRDGDQVMKWELQRPVLGMDYASPLHWRNRGKVVIAESDAISLWDVNSLSSQALLSVSSSGRRISALHVNNTDAEPGGGVRQRISSSEAEGNDGVFCTPDSINVLDFRHPSGIGLKIPKVGVNVNSAFSRGDFIFIGCTNLMSAGKRHSSSQIQQFSIRTNRLLTSYVIPESNAHHNVTELTQVWGNSSYVMGVCGLGLHVFDSLKDDGIPLDFGSSRNCNEIIGPDDMYSPSFDYLSSRVLIISRDRPACWRYLF